MQTVTCFPNDVEARAMTGLKPGELAWWGASANTAGYFLCTRTSADSALARLANVDFVCPFPRLSVASSTMLPWKCFEASKNSTMKKENSAVIFARTGDAKLRVTFEQLSWEGGNLGDLCLTANGPAILVGIHGSDVEETLLLYLKSSQLRPSGSLIGVPFTAHWRLDAITAEHATTIYDSIGAHSAPSAVAPGP